MSPRAYNLGERQIVIDQTRARIVDAARTLLMSSTSITGFSMEAVARQADVARMTVYYQFGSKVGLLEALCDSLALNGGIAQIAQVFRKEDPLDGLNELIRLFARIWDSDRLVIRRLLGLAALDVEFEQVIQEREGRRRRGIEAIVKRLAEARGTPAADDIDETINILYMLLSFECFDTLAGPTRTCQEVAPIMQRMAHAALMIDT